jgi:hypothetical protein
MRQHSAHCLRIIISVMKNLTVACGCQEFSELSKDCRLTALIVCPEAVVLLRLPAYDESADEIIKCSVWQPLDIQNTCGVERGEAWITVYVYFVLAKCEGLKSEVMWKSLGLPLRRASRAERVRKLFDREDTFGIVAQHLLQRHTSKESKVVRFLRLSSAKLLEFAEVAMLVQCKRRCFEAGDLETKTRKNLCEGFATI